MTRVTNQFELDLPMDYIETTIPAGMTIAAYRRSRPRGGRGRLASLLGLPPQPRRA